MRRWLVWLILLWVTPAWAQGVTVDASAPLDTSVTVYRDPQRGTEPMNLRGLNGFAMISEVREVALPAGSSTIRFGGVAEGMVAVTAIVTGLPGGALTKDRDASLLSPAALVDGTLGNRVTITRTDRKSGKAVSEDAVVRTRADGGLVLQTQAGFEAVRCSGLAEGLSFPRVPAGLFAQPSFSITASVPAAGTYKVTLTYLASGFDWQANYLATLTEGQGLGADNQHLKLIAWLTVANDNGQSFAGAHLNAVAGKLNITSNYRALAQPPQGRPLRLTCYPLGSTATGSIPPPPPAPPPPPPPMLEAMASDAIMVTAQRRMEKAQNAPLAMVAKQEDLGDLKLYRVPERVTVAASGQKQIAFLDKEDVKGRFIHRGQCGPDSAGDDEPQPLTVLFRTRNDKLHGLNAALPKGGVVLFEPSSAGDLLLGEQTIRDYATDQEVEISLSRSDTVQLVCEVDAADQKSGDAQSGEDTWRTMHAELSNAEPQAVTVELQLGDPTTLQVRHAGSTLSRKDGQHLISLRLPANSRRRVTWQVRPPAHSVD